VAVIPSLVAFAQEVPPALEDWRDWALHGQEHRTCPFWMNGAFGEAPHHVCAWPQRLRLEARADGASFTISWTAYADTWLPLPGDATRWPLDVRVNGTAQPVVERGGGPAIRVDSGRHRVRGRLAWQRRPESLPVPEEIALVDLILDGQPVFPLQRAGSSLWLGRPESQAGRADALSVVVYRKLADGLPPLLETRLVLEVSGQGREASLGPVLPEGFAPTSIASTLPALLDTDGRLRVQLRPGNWQVVVAGRGLAPLDQVNATVPSIDWPTEEIWSYQAAPRFRVTTPSGGRPVDPNQVDVPAEWTQLPAFVMEHGAQLTIDERSRGMADDANRLALHRELWLDFSGRGMTARDTLTGRMVRDFRLDVAPPFELRRAQAGGRPLLVTHGDEPDVTGIELRDPTLSLSASSRLQRASGSLPVTGWLSTFEDVTVALHLPPGRELVAAVGADSSPNAWVDRWSLLDIFLLLITTMLTVRLLDRTGGLLAFFFLILSYHESVGPLWWLLVLLVFALLRRALPEGRLAAVVGALCALSGLVLTLVILPFVAHQLRLALYPQIEERAVGAWTSGVGVGTRFDDVAMMESAAPVQSLEQQEWEADQVSKRAASGVPVAAKLQRYAASNVFQAGGGEPSWEWRRAHLSWSGPVQPEQRVRLLITPAWFTRLLRVVMVGLLAVLLWRLIPVLRRELPVPGVAAPVATVLLALAFGMVASPATAQQTPDPTLLELLRQRLLKAPECVPKCGHVEDAVVTIGSGRMSVILTIHAADRIAAPLPTSESEWKITELRVDGAARSELLRRQGGSLWLPLERGVHRIEAGGVLAPVDSVELRFAVAPARVRVRSSGWDASGIREGRLLTDTLGLIRVRDAEEGPGIEGATLKVAPFVRVERELDLDLEWSVTTRVHRLAPREGSLTVGVPLLDGESVLSPGFEVSEGRITAALAAGVSEVSWRSRLERVERLELKADEMTERSEAWRVVVSPQWSARFEGVPTTYPRDAEGYWVHEFHPLPGETLAISVDRPEAVAGATLAVDTARLETRVGRRASEHTLSATLRATRGGQHTVELPVDAEVLEVTLDGAAINVRPDQGLLAIPIRPGEQQLVVRWRDGQGAGLWVGTPEVDLGASASNLHLNLGLSAARWVLGTTGPRVGPAVLYWGELLVMVLLAYLLSRLGGTPLRFVHWLLLGLGFSTFSWAALVVVVVWLYALHLRSKTGDGLSWWRFDLMQLALIGLTVAALLCMLVAVPYGLLGSPDMHVVGNGSSSHDLRWFDDQSDGPLPRASVLSLPLIFYRLAMLAWALWLANAIVGWLRWGWKSLNTGGGWRNRPPRAQAPKDARAEVPEAP
jgi:hypothetical protein